MSSIYQKTRQVREVLTEIVGETRIKTFFSYYAIFNRGLMFGLYKDNKLYLRLPEKITKEDFPHTLKRLIDIEKDFGDKYFYYFPAELLPELSQYASLINTAIYEISKQKLRKTVKRKKLIRSMTNLNVNIERLLKKIGIHSIADFTAKGPFVAYAEMIKIGIDASQDLLFKLYGAINKQLIYTMSDELKLQILRDADKALYEIGLRKRFNV